MNELAKLDGIAKDVGIETRLGDRRRANPLDHHRPNRLP